MIGIDSSPLLKIRRVVVTGELGCDIKLDNGINIIKGESFQGDISASNNCGKTLFTDLIKYGLGDRDKFTSGDIAEKIQTLALEVELNNKIFTIIRDLKSYSARLSIYEASYEKDIELREPSFQTDPKTTYSDFLLDQLNIPKVRVPISNKPGATIRPITFQDFMRVFYMDQKNSFQEILNKVSPEWLKTKTFKILLGMSKEEEEQLQLRIKELIDKISSKEKEITNNTNFLKRSGAQNRIDIIEKRNTIYDKINSLAVEINTLKQKMRGDRGLTDDLRDQLDQLDKRVVSLQESKNKILVKLDDFRSLRNSLSNDREKLDKTREANFILSSIDFGRCPRCLQEITAEMKKREDDSNCMLCGRELIVKESDIRILDRKNVVEEEIKETDILLEKYQADLKNLDIELDKYIKGKTVLQNELDSQSSSYVSPFVDELERLLHERNSHNAQVELLEQQLRLWQSLEESEIELSELRIEQRKLQTALAELDTRDDEKIRRLSEYYESFLRGSQFPKLISARISPETLMPLVNGHAYTEDTGIGFISVKVIGFHFSLLRFSLDIPCYYPRFLMMDSPRQFDINPETYKSMLLQLFGVEKKRKKSDFQLILTTRDLPEDLEPFVIERLNSKNRMLLRKEEQREQSSAP
jgi:hypothetical protein